MDRGRQARWVSIATAVALVALVTAILLDVRYHARLVSWTPSPADEGAPPGRFWAAAGALMWLVFLVGFIAAAVGWTTWFVGLGRRRSVRG